MVVWVFGIMLTGGLVAAFSARPLVNAYQAWAAGRLVEKAELEIERDGLTAAYRSAWKAFELAPEDPRVMRLMAGLLMNVPTELDRAIYFYQRLKDKGEATTDDEVALVRCHLMSDRIGEADLLLEEVAGKQPNDPSVLHIRSEMEARRGRDRRSAELLREAFSLETVPDKQLDLAMAMLTQGDGPMVEGAIDAIGDLTERPDRTGLRALEQSIMLVGEGRLDQKHIPQLAEKLVEHPEATDQHLLMRESLRILQHPEQKPEIVKAAIRARIGRPIHELVRFFDWLVLEDEAAWVLDLVTGNVAVRHPEVLEVYLRALIEERRWKELEQVLAQPELPLGDLRKKLLKVRVGLVTGKNKREMLREAYNALRLAKGSGDLSAVIEATAIAERLGDSELVEFGLSTMEGTSVLREGALEGRFKLARRNRDFEQMRAVTSRILRLDPGNKEHRDLGLYYELLLGERIELVAARLRELEGLGESGPMNRFLLAFAALRGGDQARAVELAGQIDPWQLEQGPRAVLAAILDLGGEARRAADIARRIPVEMVLAPERRFLEAAMAR